MSTRDVYFSGLLVFWGLYMFYIYLLRPTFHKFVCFRDIKHFLSTSALVIYMGIKCHYEAVYSLILCKIEVQCTYIYIVSLYFYNIVSTQNRLIYIMLFILLLISLL